MRLEVMERDNFTCLDCGATDRTLNVHHTYYLKGRSPWDYEPESLRTLCETCHEKTTDRTAEMMKLIGMIPPEVHGDVLGYLRATAALNAGSDEDVMLSLTDLDQVYGACAAIGVGGIEREQLTNEAMRNGGRLSLHRLIGVAVDQGRRRAELVREGLL